MDTLLQFYAAMERDSIMLISTAGAVFIVLSVFPNINTPRKPFSARQIIQN